MKKETKGHRTWTLKIESEGLKVEVSASGSKDDIMKYFTKVINDIPEYKECTDDGNEPPVVFVDVDYLVLDPRTRQYLKDAGPDYKDMLQNENLYSIFSHIEEPDLPPVVQSDFESLLSMMNSVDASYVRLAIP